MGLINGLSGLWPEDKTNAFTTQTNSPVQLPGYLKSRERNGAVLQTPASVTTPQPAYENAISNLISGIEGYTGGLNETSTEVKNRESDDSEHFLLSVVASLRGSPWQKMPLSQLPSKRDIEGYIDSYFSNFHHVSDHATFDILLLT